MMIRRPLVALLALLCAAQLFASSNDAGWRSDIQFLTSELPKRHRNAFFRTSKQAFDSASAALVAAVPSLSDSEVAVRMYQLVAMIGDGHTTVTGVSFRTYPAGLYWFDEGMYVIRATSEHADLLGMRVVSIGGKPIGEAIEAVSTVFPYENESWRRHLAPSYLVAAEVLHALKPSGDAASAAFTFERTDGTTFGRTLSATGANTNWVEPEPPLSRRNAEMSYWAEYLPAQRALYLKYNRCRNDPAKSFAAFLNETMASVAGKPLDTLVLDLRDNPGGDSSVLQPLISGVQSTPWLNRADHFFVLIGRRTFSSALLNAIQLEQQTNATLVGEPTGGKPNSYGEILNFRLPSSGLTVFYSTKFFEVLPDNDAPSLPPEIAIAMPASAYLAGRDPVFDYVLPPPARRRGIRN